MKEQSFNLNNAADQVVTIRRGQYWRDIVIWLDDLEIARFASWQDLKGGRILKTPAGDVTVEYKRGNLSANGFSVWYDGQILEGSVGHPAGKWITGYRIAIGIGIFNLLIGLYFWATLGAYRGGSIIWYQLGFGGALVLLGLWSRTQRSAIALGLAALIFGGDGLFGLVMLMQNTTAAGSQFTAGYTGGLFFRAFLIMLIVRGAMAAWAMRPQYSYEKAKNSY